MELSRVLRMESIQPRGNNFPPFKNNWRSRFTSTRLCSIADRQEEIVLLEMKNKIDILSAYLIYCLRLYGRTTTPAESAPALHRGPFIL